MAMNLLASQILDKAKERGVTVATAESCTGGMVAAALTAIAGSSAMFERGWVTYSNQAKHDELGVTWDDLNAHGAVSEPVAIAMAEGALAHCPADLTVAVTGIAGPDGGTATKPVGLVHFACAHKDHPTRHARHIFTGTRSDVRTQAAKTALTMLLDALTSN